MDEDDRIWSRVEALRAWLDDTAGAAVADNVTLWRVLKIGEEFGEVVEALHGATGANPRKGRSHTWDDVNAELCDVIVTAMVALATTVDDPGRLLDERLDHLVRRAGLAWNGPGSRPGAGGGRA